MEPSLPAIQQSLATTNASTVEFGAALAGAVSFEDMADRAVRVCAKILKAEVCTFWRAYQDEKGQRRLRLAAATGIQAPRTLAQEVTYAITDNPAEYDGVTSFVASTRSEVLEHDWNALTTKHHFCWRGRMDKIQWEGEPRQKMRNLFAVPIVLGDEVLGALKVENKVGFGSFTNSDVHAMRSLARDLAPVAKSLELLDTHESQLIEPPASLIRALVRSLDPDALTTEIVETTAKALDAEICSLWVVDPSGHYLVPKAYHGFQSIGQVPRYQIDINPADDHDIEGVTAWVGIRKKPYWVNTHAELRAHPSWRGRWDKDMWKGKDEAETKFHSMYAVPLLWQDQLLGVLKVENPKGKSAFSPADRSRFDLMANFVTLLLAITTQLRVQLVPDVAHILNTPAASLATVLQQMERELIKDAPSLDRLRNYIDFVKRDALTISTMSRTLSAEVAARTEYQARESTGLQKLLETTVSRIRPMAPMGIDLILDIRPDAPHLPLTRSERTWLEIVLFNLLHNAFKYSPPGGTISVSCREADSGTDISVIDQGKGIPEEDLPHLFEPGYREEEEGWAQGLGLSLYTVRRLLKQIGWTCEAGNEPGSGARFTIHIPERWRHEHVS